jgi:hypothetical protein
MHSCVFYAQLHQEPSSCPQVQRANAAEMRNDEDKDCGHGVNKLFLLLEPASQVSSLLLSIARLTLTPSPTPAVTVCSLVQDSFDLPTKEIRWNFKQPINDYSNECINP